MGRLIFTAITSLDGRLSDDAGDFSWAAPDAEVHAFINDLERNVGTYLLGRRMYEVMLYWETVVADSPIEQDFADVWRGADKIVYSTQLAELSSERTRLERQFDPATVRAFVAASDRDVSIAGPTLASLALRAGIVDEVQWFVNPLLVGNGPRFLPDDVRQDLELLEVRRFDGGVVFLRYAVASTQAAG